MPNVPRKSPTRRASPRAAKGASDKTTGGARRRDATRSKIQRAAEKLFAREGFDRVTLRQIARASGQGNVAAVQYHFGSKEGLLAAIVDAHQSQIDRRRQTLLAESESAGRGDELSTLLWILLAPLVERLDDPSGRAYLRIQAQGLQAESMRPTTLTVAQRIGRSLGQVDGAPADPLRTRFAVLLLFHALADRARQEESGSATRGDRAAFVRSLGGALQGLFTAPDVA